MAFTLAHMAAALPFYRCQKWLNVEALLIGTMLPDLPYFLNSAPIVGQHSHQWLGLLEYCLPWGLLVFVLWHWVLKSPLIALIYPWQKMPDLDSRCVDYSMQADLPQHPFGLWLAARFKHISLFWMKVVISLLLGATTHLLWDGTTHPDGFIAIQLGLHYSVTIAYLGDMPLARFLQYLTSILGLGLLIGFAATRLQVKRLLNFNAKQQKIGLKRCESIIIIILLCLCSSFWGFHAAMKWHKLLLNDYYLFLAKILVGTLQGAGGFIFLYAVLYWGLFRLGRAQRL